jgi:hypothetical protein
MKTQSAERKLTLRRTTVKNLKTLTVRAGLKAGKPPVYKSVSTCPRCACAIDCAD